MRVFGKDITSPVKERPVVVSTEDVEEELVAAEDVGDEEMAAETGIILVDE
jgi:predicted metalloprotease